MWFRERLLEQWYVRLGDDSYQERHLSIWSKLAKTVVQSLYQVMKRSVTTRKLLFNKIHKSSVRTGGLWTGPPPIFLSSLSEELATEYQGPPSQLRGGFWNSECWQSPFPQLCAADPTYVAAGGWGCQLTHPHSLWVGKVFAGQS